MLRAAQLLMTMAYFLRFDRLRSCDNGKSENGKVTLTRETNYCQSMAVREG